MKPLPLLPLLLGACVSLLAQCRQIEGTRLGPEVCCNTIKLVQEDGTPLRNTQVVVKRAKNKWGRPHVSVTTFVPGKTMLRARTDSNAELTPQLPSDSYFVDARRNREHLVGTMYFFAEVDRHECSQELKISKVTK